jgi:two-component system, response regulator PdtaR
MLSMHGVLLVEDEALIAMEVARGLAQSGYRVLGPASTVACALALLQGERPDVAILDVNIRGERVTPVARELSALGVPFVLITAFAKVEEPELRLAPMLRKPIADAGQLCQAVEALLGATRR